jgi:hypothetical protein
LTFNGRFFFCRRNFVAFQNLSGNIKDGKQMSSFISKGGTMNREGNHMFVTCLVVVTLALTARSSQAVLENHYTFDDQNNVANDSSGNQRHGELIDDTGEVIWMQDPDRGAVLQFPGSTNGFILAEVPQLPGSGFTIAFWAYRDPLLCCGAGGANDGFFQVQLDGEIPSTAQKVIGGWVQKSDGGLWGRIYQEDLSFLNLDRTVYIMEDETWTHFAYRGNGSEYEVVINGESGIGPSLEYDGTVAEHNVLSIGRQGTETWGGRLDDFRVYSNALTDEEIQAIMTGVVGTPGDFNGNQQLDAEDIELLSAEVRAMTNMAKFDLDNNMLVNQVDRLVWINELKNTYIGDSNLDGEFSSTDFVLVFTDGKYETGQPATWAQGDWNGDGRFESGDFVDAFVAAGYEKGPRPAVTSVPEPATIGVLVVGLCLVGRRGRR